jgi:hypothetical protein
VSALGAAYCRVLFESVDVVRETYDVGFHAPHLNGKKTPRDVAGEEVDSDMKKDTLSYFWPDRRLLFFYVTVFTSIAHAAYGYAVAQQIMQLFRILTVCGSLFIVKRLGNGVHAK